MIVVKTSVDKKKAKELIETIYETCLREIDLSPRPKSEFKKAYKEGRLLIAFDKKKIVGWLMLIPYTQKIQELGAGFVFSSHRRKGVFSKLVSEGVSRTDLSLVATFNKRLARKLKNHNFDEISLFGAIKITRGKFLLERLNFQRIRAIGNHYKKSKPKYFIYNNE